MSVIKLFFVLLVKLSRISRCFFLVIMFGDMWITEPLSDNYHKNKRQDGKLCCVGFRLQPDIFRQDKHLMSESIHLPKTKTNIENMYVTRKKNMYLFKKKKFFLKNYHSFQGLHRVLRLS